MADIPRPIRVYVAGGVSLQVGEHLIGERRFPGAQGRLVFAHLTAERRRAVSRDELADQLWGDGLPRSWETALRALISKLRGLLAEVGLSKPSVIAAAFGCYQLNLPPGAWVDIEAAADALHEAETALHRDRAGEAVGPALVARAVGERPFLPGADGPWATRQRARLRDIHVRALDCLAEAWIRRRDPALAVLDAQEAVSLAPFRESSHRLLMRAHATSGNRAEALRAYERCRALLAEELGADPSPETEAIYLEILGS